MCALNTARLASAMSENADTFTLFGSRWAKLLVHSHLLEVDERKAYTFTRFGSRWAKVLIHSHFLEVDERERWYIHTFWKSMSENAYTFTFLALLFSVRGQFDFQSKRIAKDIHPFSGNIRHRTVVTNIKNVKTLRAFQLFASSYPALDFKRSLCGVALKVPKVL